MCGGGVAVYCGAAGSIGFGGGLGFPAVLDSGDLSDCVISRGHPLDSLPVKDYSGGVRLSGPGSRWEEFKGVPLKLLAGQLVDADYRSRSGSGNACGEQCAFGLSADGGLPVVAEALTGP